MTSEGSAASTHDTSLQLAGSWSTSDSVSSARRNNVEPGGQYRRQTSVNASQNPNKWI